MTLAKVGVGAVVVLVAAGVAMEGLERLSGLLLRERVARSYGTVASLRAGMTREDVIARLRSLRAGRVFPDRDHPDTVHFLVHYSIFEACGFALGFRDQVLTQVASGDWNQPGPCAGAPPSWGPLEPLRVGQ